MQVNVKLLFLARREGHEFLNESFLPHDLFLIIARMASKDQDILEYWIKEGLEFNTPDWIFDSKRFFMARGEYLGEASERLKNDEGVVTVGCRYSARQYDFVGDKLRGDLRFERRLMKRVPSVYFHLPLKDRQDKEIIKIGWKTSCRPCDIDAELLRDMEFASELCQIDPDASPILPKDLKESVECAKILCPLSAGVWHSFSIRVKKNREVALVAQFGMGPNREFLTYHENDREVMKHVCKQKGAFAFTSSKTKDDYELAMIGCETAPWVFQCVSERLKDDYDFVIKVCQMDSKLIINASDRIIDMIVNRKKIKKE